MISRKTVRGTSLQRGPLWIFEEAATLRHKIIHRAGRGCRSRRPAGRGYHNTGAGPAEHEEAACADPSSRSRRNPRVAPDHLPGQNGHHYTQQDVRTGAAYGHEANEIQ